MNCANRTMSLQTFLCEKNMCFLFSVSKNTISTGSHHVLLKKTFYDKSEPLDQGSDTKPGANRIRIPNTAYASMWLIFTLINDNS
jgi:hypothetical protein